MATRKLKVSDLKVVDLRRELEERDEECSGTKSVLQQRLRQALEKAGEDVDNFVFEVPCSMADLFRENSRTLERKLEEISRTLERKFEEHSGTLERKFEENSRTLERMFEENSRMLADKLQGTFKTLYGKAGLTVEPPVVPAAVEPEVPVVEIPAAVVPVSKEPAGPAVVALVAVKEKTRRKRCRLAKEPDKSGASRERCRAEKRPAECLVSTAPPLESSPLSPTGEKLEHREARATGEAVSMAESKDPESRDNCEDSVKDPKVYDKRKRGRQRLDGEDSRKKEARHFRFKF